MNEKGKIEVLAKKIKEEMGFVIKDNGIGMSKQKIEEIINGFEEDNYNKGYQIVFAVHDDTDYVHVHFVMNIANYNTGIKYAGGFEDFNNLKAYINNAIENFG